MLSLCLASFVQSRYSHELPHPLYIMEALLNDPTTNTWRKMKHAGATPNGNGTIGYAETRRVSIMCRCRVPRPHRVSMVAPARRHVSDVGVKFLSLKFGGAFVHTINLLSMCRM